MHGHVATCININSIGHYRNSPRWLQYPNIWFTFIFSTLFTKDHWTNSPTLHAKRTKLYRDYLIVQADTQHNNFNISF